MIHKIEAYNFKSLHGEDKENSFSITLDKFTCLIGLNGSGKSTILQFIDFICCIIKGDVVKWLDDRGWQATELRYVGTVNGTANKQRNINFKISLIDDNNEITWEAIYNRFLNRCVNELFSINNKVCLSLSKNTYSIEDEKPVEINFEYEGSIVSRIKDKLLPKPVKFVIECFQHIKSLELLSPHLLRKRSRGIPYDIGRGGESITAYIGSLGNSEIKRIEKEMTKLYPSKFQLLVDSLKAGWKRMMVVEHYKKDVILSDSRHVSDGFLRLLAIVAELNTRNSFIVLDELENGLNPEVIEQLIDLLVTSPMQILVTTHSPLILNYLDDDIAIKGLQFIYRTNQGFTRSIPFFSIEENSRLLKSLGPGEVFLEVSLKNLQKQLSSI